MRSDEAADRVSQEIFAQLSGGLKAAIIDALRQAKLAGSYRRTTLAYTSMVMETLRIINRPVENEAHLVSGHSPGDMIKGAFNRSSMGTVVDRKTFFVVQWKENGNEADPDLHSFARLVNYLPAALRVSINDDRGSEMACHPELVRLKVDVWFYDPHASWQGSSKENTNGLFRQFMPKGTDISNDSQTGLNDVAALMNNRQGKGHLE